MKSEEARVSLGMLAAAGNFTGPATPGSAYQLMQRALYRGASVVRHRPKVKDTADFNARAPLGGMGAITAAMGESAKAAGVDVRAGTAVVEIKATERGVSGAVLDGGEELPASIVVSAINPKRTFSQLVTEEAVPADLMEAYRSLPMAGCMGKVYLALDGTPEFACAASPAENELLVKCGFRTAVSIDDMQDSYELARRGSWLGTPVIYGLTQTTFDPTLAPPGVHLMSLSVCYAPYHVDGNWADQGSAWAKHVISHLTQHIPNLPRILTDYRFMTPVDLESSFGLTEANALHGDVVVQRLYGWRPIPGFSDYTTPVPGLFLCSNGTWPANFVSGLPGRNAAQTILRTM
jgi:phytoene dehydrogenase-like protein